MVRDRCCHIFNGFFLSSFEFQQCIYIAMRLLVPVNTKESHFILLKMPAECAIKHDKNNRNLEQTFANWYEWNCVNSFKCSNRMNIKTLSQNIHVCVRCASLDYHFSSTIWTKKIGKCFMLLFQFTSFRSLCVRLFGYVHWFPFFQSNYPCAHNQDCPGITFWRNFFFVFIRSYFRWVTNTHFTSGNRLLFDQAES